MKNVKKQTFSAEHLAYLKKERRGKIFVILARIGLLILLLGMWELVATIGIVDPFISSSPSRVIKTIAELYQGGSLFYHIAVTLKETLLGFILAVAIGTLTALALWWSDTARKILEPYIVVLNSLPKIALGPLIIIWFGTGSSSIVFMTVIVGVVVAIMNMLGGFLATDKNKLILLRSMGASKFQILIKLVIPSALPQFIGMLKICVGMAWIGSIMGEYIVSRAGLGYLIVYGGQVFRLDLVMASTVLLCALAAAMYFLVVLLEKIVIRHPR